MKEKTEGLSAMITKEQSGVPYVTALQALECLEDMDDYARMDVGVNPIGPYNTLKEFIEQQRVYEPFGYYWEDEDYDCWSDEQPYGIWFGNPEHVLDGEKMIALYKLKE